MAKTDQQLAQEELARQGIDYKYGGDTLMGAFMPERRQVISPERNQIVGYDDRGRAMVETVPATYGPSEFDFEYTPVVRGAKAAGSFLRDVFFGDANEQAQAIGQAGSAIRGVLGAVPEMVNEQVAALEAGGAVYNPETGQLTEFDPTLVMGGAGAGQAVARRGNQALDMSNAARMQRAREMGFNIDRPLYHYTPSDVREFNVPQGDRQYKFGRGVYASADPRYGDRYVREGSGYAEGANAMPLYARGNLAGGEAYEAAWRQANENLGIRQQALDMRSRGETVDQAGRLRIRNMVQDEAQRILKDQGYDGVDYLDEVMVFDPQNVRSTSARFDPAMSDSANVLYSGGGRQGSAVAGAAAIDETMRVANNRLPPLSNAQKTQLGASTLPSYEKAAGVLGSEGRALDFGAGRGQGAQAIGFDTFEPYPREGFSPTYNTAADIPDQSYDRLTSLNVLNVMPRDVRDQAVADIGRVLRPNGRAVVTTRGRDVLNAKGQLGDEPMSIITTADTYQKGFTQPELRDYIQGQLGEEFTVSNLPEKIGQAGVLIERTGGGTTLRSGSRVGSGIAGGSAIREVFRIGDEGFDPRFDNRAKEQQRILDTELRYEGSPIIRPDVSIYDLEGKPFALTMADRTKAGSKLIGVEDVDYDIPVDLQGGQDFMFANPLGREGQVWAQDKGATSMYLNSFMGLGGQPLADEIIMLPYRMAPTGGDFATMTAETMLTHARNNMTKKSKAKVDKSLKSIYPEWKGIDNPESMNQIAMMKGDPRKKILQVMDRDFRNEGGIGIGQARLAVTDRMQYNAPDYTLQNVGAADPYMGRFEQSGHRTYSQGLAGRPIGTLIETDINAMELLPDFVRGRGFGSVDELLAADPETLAKEYYTMRRGLRGGVITEDMLRDIERRRQQ